MRGMRIALLPVARPAGSLGIPLGRTEAAQRIKVAMPVVSPSMPTLYPAQGRGSFAEKGLDGFSPPSAPTAASAGAASRSITQDELRQAGHLKRPVPFVDVATDDFLPRLRPAGFRGRSPSFPSPPARGAERVSSRLD
jgi:hypothetical protein